MNGITMEGVLHLVSLWCVLATAVGLMCRSCPDVMVPEHCKTTTTCGPDDMCLIQERRVGGQRRYSLECHSKRACAVLKLYSDNTMCLDCCDTDECNKDLCAGAPTVPSITTAQPTTTTEAPPYIETSSPSITTRWGTQTSVSCTGHNVDYIKMYETVNNRKIMLYDGHHPDAVVSITPSSDMVIVCEGYRNEQSNNILATANIPVHVTGDAPHFSQNQNTHMSVAGGKNVSLSCQPQGFPAPTVTWHYTHSNGHTQEEKNNVNIVNMNTNLAGNYQCTATNMFGTATITYVISYVVPGLTCRSCDDVMSPEHCQTTTTCSPDDMCITEERIIGGQHRYRLHCHSKRACSVLMMYPGGSFCMDCCDTDECNKDLCARTTTLPTTTTPQPTTLPPPSVETNVASVTTRWGTPVSITCSGHNVDYIVVMQSVHHHMVELYNSHHSSAEVAVTPRDNTEITCYGYMNGNSRIPVAAKTVPITVTGEAPHFSRNHVSMSVTGGQNVSLSCQPQGFPTPVVTWQYSRVSGHTITENNNINLINMNDRMAGKYTCSAHNLFGTTTLTYVISYVAPATTPQPTTQLTTPSAVAPVVTIPDKKIIDEGEPATVITCEATGNPRPKIIWTPVLTDTFPANIQALANYLVIKNPGVYDSSFFMCKAVNSAGQDIKIIHIVVNHVVKPTTAAPHVPPTIVNSPMLKEVTYGKSVTLTCDASGFPEPSITWHFNHKTVVQKSLVINNATQSDDGLYVCVATNDAGHSQANFALSVSGVSPSITHTPTSIQKNAGTTEIFTCTATGLPQPTITWSYSSFSNPGTAMPAHVKSPDGTQIRLTNIQDSGTLTCTASNPYGTVSAHANVLLTNAVNMGLGR